jgi:4-hydroxy-2-oxoheptanedioate aldolase
MNAFQEAIERQEVPLQAWMWNPSPLFAEAIVAAGFDSVGLDLQHGAIDFSDLYAMLAIFDAAGVTPMVRVPHHERGWMTRVLDAGATGIICPDVESGEDAKRFVAACKYAPRGSRSYGPTRPAVTKSSGYGDPRSGYSPVTANEEVMTVVQIESVEGMRNLEAIVNADGVDGLFPGPMDYTLSAYGELVYDIEDKRLRDPLQEMIDASHAAGVPVGLPAFSPEMAGALIEMGTDWLQMGNDMAWISTSARQTVASVADRAKGR